MDDEENSSRALGIVVGAAIIGFAALGGFLAGGLTIGITDFIISLVRVAVIWVGVIWLAGGFRNQMSLSKIDKGDEERYYR